MIVKTVKLQHLKLEIHKIDLLLVKYHSLKMFSKIFT